MCLLVRAYSSLCLRICVKCQKERKNKFFVGAPIKKGTERHERIRICRYEVKRDEIVLKTKNDCLLEKIKLIY